MLELIQRSTGVSIYVPDSGPGSKYIRAGNVGLGFMSEVPDSELDGENQLKQLAADYNPYGFPNAGRKVWLKYRRNGKSLYLPLFQLPALTANALNDMEVTFNALNETPGANPATLVNGKPMYKINGTITAPDGSLLIVRLISAREDQFSMPGVTTPVASEYKDLISDIYDTGATSSFGYRRNVSEITFPAGHPDTPAGSYFVMQQLQGNGTMTMSARATNNVADLRSISGSSSASFMRWFPILEYVPPDIAAKYAINPKPLRTTSLTTVDGFGLTTDSDQLIDPLYIRSTGQTSTAINPVSNLEASPSVIVAGSQPVLYAKSNISPAPSRILAGQGPVSKITVRPTIN